MSNFTPHLNHGMIYRSKPEICMSLGMLILYENNVHVSVKECIPELDDSCQQADDVAMASFRRQYEVISIASASWDKIVLGTVYAQ